MIYLFHSPDFVKAKNKAEALVSSLLLKKPDATMIKISAENFLKYDFGELVTSQALFQSKFIVLVLRLFENEDFAETLLEKMEEIKNSSNIFIFAEGEMESHILKAFESNAQKIENISGIAPNSVKKELANVFAISDAVSSKNKKLAWVLLEEAILKGVPGEEIHGALFWQMKTIMIAKNSRNEKDSGLKGFTYSKAVSKAKGFTNEELKKIIFDLAELYNNSRTGAKTLEEELEGWVLGL